MPSVSMRLTVVIKRVRANRTPESSQWVGAQEVVVADILVSCNIDNLMKRR